MHDYAEGTYEPEKSTPGELVCYLLGDVSDFPF
jgi:hypothetical protein